MMQYHIIESYAYDVIGDIIRMMSYESRRAHNTKKHNIILSLELELLDWEYKLTFQISIL